MTADAAANLSGQEKTPAVPTMMRAWSQTSYGGPEVVKPGALAVPTPGSGEVLLRIRATALNSADVRVMRGEPLLLRAAFGGRRPRQRVRGHDVAATVVGLGAAVTEFHGGDEVLGEINGGGLAEYAIAPVSRLVPRPAPLDPVIAAALPMAGGTAWQALDLAAVAEGQRVLVIGASGGVGTMAVQLAHLRGAEVWALCGQRSRALVESIGAQRTFDYRMVQPGMDELSPKATEGGFDTVIDIAGTAPLRRLRELLRPGGFVVLVSGEGNRVLGPVGRLLAASVMSIGSKRRFRPLAAVAKPQILEQLVALAAGGALAPVIERTWSFADADKALAHVDSGRTVGKVIVTAARVGTSSQPPG
ncbi:NADPH:quinone reductase-like Zn-dependent oxidoreductase [Rhodoglobus vestalii]|uniref:NADPH:quinone reductase-like Zn-dependent oxidoreductase n=1 Tax=Rhodoglobus vestalii TaxID=193384 RepID=A0A8H2K8S5_9MICO|nr:NAD(P)-dependent alcohol dehydrogenase [Rhodoglobus vestalii]TQO19766.1 NADPH:quinone reductase-like Zn-dependent oxidoreductase [Rhodoglobus vestalii]